MERLNGLNRWTFNVSTSMRACVCACVSTFLSFSFIRSMLTLRMFHSRTANAWCTEYTIFISMNSHSLSLSLSSFNEFNDTIQTRFERKEAYVRHSIRTHCTVTLCYPCSSHSHILMQTCMHERDHTIRVMRIIPLRFQKSKQSIDVAFVSRKRTKETKKNQNL